LNWRLMLLLAWLGLRSGSSVSHQLRRLRCGLCEDKQLAGLLNRAERRLRRETNR
jgi:hypothetical protein